jgi:hypothetical protein
MSKDVIKNEDTTLYRVSYIDGVSECFYVSVKKSDIEHFDFQTQVRNLFYMGTETQREKLTKFSDTIENGFLEFDECDESETKMLFEDEENDENFIYPNIFVEPTKKSNSVKITSLTLENPYSD